MLQETAGFLATALTVLEADVVPSDRDDSKASDFCETATERGRHSLGRLRL